MKEAHLHHSYFNATIASTPSDAIYARHKLQEFSFGFHLSKADCVYGNG
jgi:hypothetical protein